MKTFFILWNPDGRTPPTKRFDTLEEAKNVAANMQARIGVGTMYVMRVVGGVEVTQDIVYRNVADRKG